MTAASGDPDIASAAHHPHHVAAPAAVEEAREALRHGPRGALVVASGAVALLVAGWLSLYFLLFLPRGPVN